MNHEVLQGLQQLHREILSQDRPLPHPGVIRQDPPLQLLHAAIVQVLYRGHPLLTSLPQVFVHQAAGAAAAEAQERQAHIHPVHQIMAGQEGKNKEQGMSSNKE